MNKQELYDKSFSIVKNKFQHKHYDRTVKLSQQYLALLTGENAETLLRQFNLREDNDTFDQRIRITQLITPCVVNSLMNPQRKVSQVKPLIKEIGYSSSDKDGTNRKDMLTVVNSYFSGKDIDYFQKEKDEVEAHIQRKHGSSDIFRGGNPLDVLAHFVKDEITIYFCEGGRAISKKNGLIDNFADWIRNKNGGLK